MNILFFVMTALVFVMWAGAVFSMIFATRRRAAERTGKALPGPMDTLREWGFWLREPTFKQERQRLLIMTIAVLGLSYLATLSLGAPP